MMSFGIDGPDLPACGTLAGSRRAFAVAGRQAPDASERTSTGAYRAALRRVLKFG
ncbi:hypothetical protein [Burkholderia ambifaria]|uniref:hypothetical protein n=1 Tax=Burkholderia ambifaria TaxID=152480 RepID=UPI00158D214B|nr:hypothetical protein [Burkholderia ambifaria]